MILKDAPAGSAILDLEAVRAARTEAHKDEAGPVVKVSAGYLQLRREIDVTAGMDFARAKFREGLEKLLEDPADVDDLLSGGFSTDDINAVINFISGRSLGESPASA